MNIAIRIIILAVLALNAAAQTFPGRLSGSWKGEGRIFGAPAKAGMRWEPILGGKFVSLTWRNEWKGQDGKPQVFEGQGVYKALTDGTCNGWWFDSRGMVLPIESTFDETVLNSNWGSPETESGRTTYRLVDESQVEVVDSVRMKDGSWREFARYLFRKS